jgi:copper homeostasis protein CutC
MKSDISACAQLGADGVVFGCLKMDGRVDVQLTQQLLAVAKQHVSLV